MTERPLSVVVAALSVLLLLPLTGCSRATDPISGDDESGNREDAVSASDLGTVVGKMAAIGWATGASYSPADRRVAYLSSETGTPQVWVRDISTGVATQATFFEDQVSAVRWSPKADVLAVSVAPGGGLNTQIYLSAVPAAEPRQITAGGTTNNWLGKWSDDGRYLSYSSNALGNGSMDCYVYDTERDEAVLIAENDGIGVIEDMSSDGKRAVIWRMKSRGDTNLHLLDIASGREQLLTPHDGPALSDLALFMDDDTLLISTNIDREMVALGRIDIDAEGTASPLRIVSERDDAELEEFATLDEGTRAVLIWNSAGRNELAYYDIESETTHPGPTLPAEIAGSLAADATGSRLAMTVSGAATPLDVWELDVADQSFARISASSHDGVDLANLIRPRLIRYQAHDGIELTGWLYMPAGADAPVPIVTSFHGGPEGQERPRFRSTYQALLTRGIGIFAPNVRGSAGFGKTFVNLDNGELRFDGVRDIQSTVLHLIDSGIADPERIGIMGGSYGGYMVMAGLVTYPEMFSAGANLFGIVNFETFFANTEPWMAAISTVEYGDPQTQAELLQRLSPINKLDRIAAPTIVLHGANDTNVPVVEAEQVVDSLKTRGVPVKYVLFPDEGHGWRKTANRVTSDIEIVRWFETYL